MKLLSAVALAAAISARFPSAATPGTVTSLDASADPGTVAELSAMGVRTFTDVSGSLKWVKAEDHFGLAGETIVQGTILQVTEAVAKELLFLKKVTEASDADVAAARAEDAAAAAEAAAGKSKK